MVGLGYTLSSWQSQSLANLPTGLCWLPPMSTSERDAKYPNRHGLEIGTCYHNTDKQLKANWS
jgi:hypothetical protein